MIDTKDVIALDGVPYIKTESNAIGSCIKFADGTMIVFQRKVFTNIDIVNPAGTNFIGELDFGAWAFPFISAPVQSRTIVAPGFFLYGQSYGNGTLIGGGHVAYHVAVPKQSVWVDIVGYGRWK